MENTGGNLSAAAPSMDEIRAAAERIGPYVRHTPILAASPMRRDLTPGARLLLKLECLQVTGSFKPRGAVAKLTSLPTPPRAIVTASGGNHGIAVAYAGAIAKCPARIYLPSTAPSEKAQKIRALGAEVRIVGTVWDEANAAALADAERENLVYFHPFADRQVIAGQATVGLEILSAAPLTDTLLVAIGGGGLMTGIALAAKALRADIRIIGIEPTGAPTLHDSIAAGRLVTLREVATKAGTLAPRRSAEVNFEVIRSHVDEIVLVSDTDMQHAARWLWQEAGIAAELSGAASLAAIIAGKIRFKAGETITAVVCGAGTDGLS
jgi:threonine dehydratase